MTKNATENSSNPNSKNIACVSWHSTLPPNTGANVRIRNILFNLKTIKPIFISPKPKDTDLQHYTFEPFKVPDFINHLVPFNLEILEYVSFILVIASLVQLVEMFIRKISKPLYDALGIYLPLITTNCAILGLALFAVLCEYNFIESLIFGIGAGVGFTIAIVLMAGIREELELAKVPKPFQGAGITMIVAAGMALAFMGFAGLISV